MCLKLLSTHLEIQAEWPTHVPIWSANLTDQDMKLKQHWITSKCHSGTVAVPKMYDMQMQTLDLRSKFYFYQRSHPKTSKVWIYVKFQSRLPTFVKLHFGSPTHVKLRSGPQYFKIFQTGLQSILLVLQVVRIFKLIL